MKSLDFTSACARYKAIIYVYLRPTGLVLRIWEWMNE
jgi:hypothetical protein